MFFLVHYDGVECDYKADLENFWKSLTDTERHALSSWGKINATLTEMNTFINTNDYILDNIPFINETKPINEKFKKITDFTRDWCSTILNILDTSSSVNMDTHRKTKLQYHLDNGILNMECATKMKIYNQSYKDMVAKLN